MFSLTYFLYLIVLGFITSYKWIELQVLKLFKPLIRRKAMEITHELGIVLHVPGSENEKNAQHWTSLIETCNNRGSQGKYETLIHIKVKDPDTLFLQTANKLLYGFAETYIANEWEFTKDEGDIGEILTRIIENNITDLYWNKWNRFLDWLQLSAFNLQTKARAFQVGKKHYDLGNDLFEKILDPWLQYSCGYWAKADNLNQAQIDKMELIARKLDLKPGMKILDIGCGWGTLCKYLAEKYKVECVGVTVSKEGVEYGKRINEGLPVDIRLQDYRDVNEKFDRIVSIGMFEHVGHKNYRKFMKVVDKCLVEDGIFLLHTIGRNHVNFPRTDPWSHQYIFRNGNLPNPKEIVEAAEGYFIIEDWHNFGSDYVKTLESWRENLLKRWPSMKEKYENDSRFYRMWVFYLSGAVGLFKSRRSQLWQIVLSKDGLKTGYRAAR